MIRREWNYIPPLQHTPSHKTTRRRKRVPISSTTKEQVFSLYLTHHHNRMVKTHCWTGTATEQNTTTWWQAQSKRKNSFLSDVRTQKSNLPATGPPFFSFFSFFLSLSQSKRERERERVHLPTDEKEKKKKRATIRKSCWVCACERHTSSFCTRGERRERLFFFSFLAHGGGTSSSSSCTKVRHLPSGFFCRLIQSGINHTHIFHHHQPVSQ